MAPNRRMALSRHLALALGTLLGGALLLTSLAACSGPAPLTRDHRDEEEDDAARVENFETAALTYYEGGRYDNSILMWRKVLVVEPDNAKAKWGLARALMGKRDPVSLREAEDLLLAIMPLDWDHPTLGDRTFELKRDLANVYGTLADYYERDIRVLEDKLTNDPNADAEWHRSKLAEQKRKRNALLNKAIPVYRDVLQSSPNNQYALAGLAKSHFMMGNEDVGLDYASRYIRLARSSREGWKKQLAREREKRGGELTTNQRNFFRDKIYGTIQKEKNVTLMMGSVYMRREEFGSAVAMFSRVLDMDDGEVAAYVERAQAYAGLGQYQMAVKDIEEYLKYTDPEMHRTQRVKAGSLLQTYQRIIAQPKSMNPGMSSGGFPAPSGGGYASPTPYAPSAAPAPTPYAPSAAPAPTPYAPSAAPMPAPVPASGFPAPSSGGSSMLPGAGAPAPMPLPAGGDDDLPDLGGAPAPAPSTAPSPIPASTPSFRPPAPPPAPAAEDDGLGPPPAGVPRRR